MSDLEHEPPLEPVEPVVEAPEAEAPEPEEIAPEVIEQARKYGWKAPEEWKGEKPPKGFMAPTDYLELPGVQNKILRDEMAELRKAQEERERATADKLARMDRMYEESAKRREESHKREVERIKAEQRRAVEAGDTDRWDALEKEREGLSPPPKEQQQEDPEVAYISHWVNNLPADHWWRSDPVLQATSGVLYNMAPPNATPQQKVAFVEKRIREEFPHKFPSNGQQKPRTSKVDGGGLGMGKQSLADKLPPEAKAVAKRDIADNLFKDMEEYAKHYFEQEEGV